MLVVFLLCLCDLYFILGDVEKVKIAGLTAALRNSFQPSRSELTRHINGVMSLNAHSCPPKKRVAVLISGSGMYVMLFISCSYRSQHVVSALLLLSVLCTWLC